jgi:hypothetical protein
MMTRENAHIRRSFDHIVLNAFRPVLVGLMVLYVFFAITHKLVLPPEYANWMVALAFGSGVVFALLWLALKYERVPIQHAHLFGAFVTAMMLGNSAVHMFLTGDWLQTTNFLLIVIGIACIFLSLAWLIVIEMMAIGSWALVAWFLPSSPAVIHFGIAFVTTIFLATIIFLIRANNFRRLEEFRLHQYSEQN